MKKKGLVSRFGKGLVEILCVVLVCSMVLGAVSVVLENFSSNKPTSESNYVIYGCVEHPYVKRPVYNATVVLWNLRTNETNVSYTNETGYYNIDLNEAGISHQTGDQIKILTYYMHYSSERVITIDGNSSHQVDVKLRNSNHFNNYNLPELNFTLPDYNETFEDDYNLTDYNFTEPEMPDFENYTYPENSTKRLPNLTVSDVSYDKLILGNQTQLNITIKNINNETAYSVTVDVYYENNNDELLGTLSYGDITPNETKTASISWTPIVADINNLKIVIFVGEQKENTIIIGFYVWEKPMGTVSVSEELPAYLTGDVIIGADAYTGAKDVLVEEAVIKCYGNLTINSTATLTFKKNVELVMISAYAGEHSIEVKPNARFEILGEKGTESIIHAENSQRSFKFICNAKSSFSMRNGIVMWTYGQDYTPGTEPLPGGIQLDTESTANIQDSEIIRGETHNIYAKGASVTISNSRITGNRVSGGSGIGYGVYLVKDEAADKESSLYLNDTVIEKSWECGIYAEKSGVYITGSKITENDYGVYLYEANPEVKIYTDCLSDGSGKKTIEFPEGGMIK